MAERNSTFPPVARSYRTALHAFAAALGLGQRGLVKAGARIGLNEHQTRYRTGEKTPVTEAEKLAMTAALFNLPPLDDRMVNVDARCRLAFDMARAELLRCIGQTERDAA